MYFRRVCIYVLIIFLAVAISACDIVTGDVKGLIQLPQTSGDEAQIMQLIYKNTDEQKYDLIYPQKGNYRSAVVIKEVKTGNKLACAFYSIPDQKDKNIHMLVMGKSENDWNVISEEILHCGSITKLEFCDLYDVGCEQIIVDCNSYNTTSNNILVYNYQNNDKTGFIDIRQNHDEFDVYDYNKDGKYDILLLESAGSATLLTYSSTANSFETISQTRLNPTASECKNFVSGKLNDKTKAYFIDSSTSDGRLFTQLVYWNDEIKSLTNPFYMEDVNANPSIRNSIMKSKLYSVDIDNDGNIEIPLVENSNINIGDDFNEDWQSIYNIISWYYFDLSSNSLSYKMSTVIDEENGFYVLVPSQYKNNIIVIKDSKENSLIFKISEQNETGIVAKAELMEIGVFSADDWKNSPRETYEKITDIGDKVCAVKFAEKSKEYGIDISSLINNFKIL